MSNTVEEILLKKKIEYQEKGSDFLIKCLNPEHDDSSPSMRVDKVMGIYHCWSCNFKGNIFKLFGAKPNWLEIKRQKVKQLIYKKLAESIGLEIPAKATPFQEQWRGISAETFAHFRAFKYPADPFKDRVVFPITDFTGKIVAFLGRHTEVGVKDRYHVFPEKTSLPIFPLVQPIGGSILLVEGIFDMLNLHDKGITNAVALFGANIFNVDKLETLKLMGASSIDLLLDPDEAGQAAAKKIQELCEEHGISCRNTKIKDVEKDPGSLSKIEVQRLRKHLYG